MRKTILRSGYTTGACAAAAAKAATMLVMRNALGVMGENPLAELDLITHHPSRLTEVDIPFPDGSRVSFTIHSSGLENLNSQFMAWASVIKDAGDDPDVTNGAEIVAEVVMCNALCDVGENMGKRTSETAAADPSRITDYPSLVIKGGRGVGRVTKPGLPVPVGESAINPVPRKMIREAVLETVQEFKSSKVESLNTKPSTFNFQPSTVEVTISVPDGEKLAKKTLNPRLGIIGGISILGTSGIVKPLSSEAWTASITASMDVARALNLEEIVVSAGRVSEKAHMEKYNLPEEAYVMMGDYLEFSLLDAKKHGFTRVHLCAQWAKMLKIAMATPQTHVRHGAIDIEKAVELLNSLGITIPQDPGFNTAREVFEHIVSAHGCEPLLFREVCNAAKRYTEGITGGIPVVNHLVSYHGEVLVSSE
ncbi:MAG: cobalt-precorrin-5B (C(1))-methyltransferase CbiD [Nitrospirae bacterium]|nr:cobalt-precorrin-5B (C(1))-methyltransferase CbiD [Nitrospirota bacterium]